MLLTITTTHAPATDLGFLLHKHPARVQARAVASGTAHVFYPEAGDGRCTAALLLEVDPLALVRGRGSGGQRHEQPGITGEQHDVPGHRVRVRRSADRSQLSRTGSCVCSRATRLLRPGQTAGNGAETGYRYRLSRSW